MKVKLLNRDIQQIKKHLDGKRRVMTYGAGAWFNDIKKMLLEYGYKLDYAFIDAPHCNGNISSNGLGGGTEIVSIEKLGSLYMPESDALIWAIGSPEKLRNCMKDDSRIKECFLIWDMGFWKDKNYFFSHKKEFKEVSGLLCDEYSQKVFWGYIKAQKGNICEDILYSINGTYFNELTKEKRAGAFLDCGAYKGESVIDYMRFFGEECKIYAFEPDSCNYKDLAHKMKNRTNIICLNKGCYSSEKILSFDSQGDMSSSLQENGKECVEVTTIDKIVGNEKIAFIKMDIEGAELEALKGARNVIERDMPVLAISAYHRQEDLITLLPYINNFRSIDETEEYKLYLRHHGVGSTELVIYAIPRKKDVGM